MEKKAVPYKTVYKDTQSLAEGMERVIQKGVDGLMIVETQPMNGLFDGQVLTTHEMEIYPINEVIERGIGVLDVRVSEYTESVPFEIIEMTNHDLPEGESKVIQPGVEGEVLFVTKTPTLNDVANGESITEQTIIKEPIPEKIEIGTGVIGELVETTVESIPFEREYLFDQNMPLGEVIVLDEGIDGEEEITTYTPTFNDLPNGDVSEERVLLKEPEPETIVMGTGEFVYEVVELVEPIPFDTVERVNNALSQGEQKVIQAGIVGEKEVTMTTPLLNGEQVGMVDRIEVITKHAVDALVEVGAGDLTVSEIGPLPVQEVEKLSWIQSVFSKYFKKEKEKDGSF